MVRRSCYDDTTMKILILTPLYWPSIGGVQVSMALLAAYLVKNNHSVKVLTSQMKDLDEGAIRNFRRIVNFPASEQRDGVSIRRFPTGGPLDSLFALMFAAAYRLKLFFWPRLYRLYRQRRFRASSILRHAKGYAPDIIVAGPFMDELTRLGLEARRRTGAKLVIKTSLHISSAGLELKDLSTLKECDAIITNTPAEKDFLVRSGVPESILHVTGASVDIESLEAASSNTANEELKVLFQKKYVLFLGRKQEGKGLTTLVEAFLEPFEALKNTTLVLAGLNTDYFDERIRPRISGNPFIQVIETLDEPSKWPLLKHAAVYCMVSNIDSFGISYLEAWLSGVPVVAADVPAMRYVIKDQKTDFWCPTRIRTASAKPSADCCQTRLSPGVWAKKDVKRLFWKEETTR